MKKSKIRLPSLKLEMMKEITRDIVFILALLIVPVSGLNQAQSVERGSSAGFKIFPPLSKSYNYDNILVERVVDGDTLKLENGERVRLIGIDTPETHKFAKLYRDSRKSGQDVNTIMAMGQKAYAFTRSLVEKQYVRLEFDLEKYDRYGRLLAYVYLKDGTFVNAEIIKEGYANLLTYPPNVKYSDLFLKLYRQARDKKLGLWQD